MERGKVDKLVLGVTEGLIQKQQFNKDHLELLEANYKIIKNVSSALGMVDVEKFAAIALIFMKGMAELSKLINNDLELFEEGIKEGKLTFEGYGNNDSTTEVAGENQPQA